MPVQKSLEISDLGEVSFREVVEFNTSKMLHNLHLTSAYLNS